MNPDLFHHTAEPAPYHKVMDRRNRHTGNICYYYELSGWYDSSVKMRLLGHHRLFQLRKLKYERTRAHVSPERAYILHYNENGIIKDTWLTLIPFIKKIFRIEPPAEVKSISRILVDKRSDILENFLIAADIDFEQAFHDALTAIRDPSFLSTHRETNVHLEFHENHQHNTSLSKNEFHVHPAPKEDAPPQKPAKGKEEGVFSKKQMLIILDLLASAKLIEPINLNNPNKFPAIAELLHAITGHAESSWKAALDDYKGKNLYAYDKEGARQELIRILVNIEEKFEKAGFTTMSDLAYKKRGQIQKFRP